MPRLAFASTHDRAPGPSAGPLTPGPFILTPGAVPGGYSWVARVCVLDPTPTTATGPAALVHSGLVAPSRAPGTASALLRTFRRGGLEGSGIPTHLWGCGGEPGAHDRHGSGPHAVLCGRALHAPGASSFLILIAPGSRRWPCATYCTAGARAPTDGSADGEDGWWEETQIVSGEGYLPMPPGCAEAFITPKDVLAHVEAIHIQRGGLTPDDGWLASMGRRQCEGCRRLMARTAPLCPACQRAAPAPAMVAPPPQGSPLSGPRPQWSLTIDDILADRRGVLEHVPRGCRAAVLQALGRVLGNFCAQRTWESLRDLLGFGKVVLAAPPRGGRRRLPALEREIILRANALGNSPLEALWARSTPRKTTSRKSTKPLPRVDESVPTQDDALPENIVSRVTSLVAEGALSKACKHMVSNGLWDTADFRVQRKLQDLHPLAPAPDLTALGADLGSLPRFTWDTSLRGTADRLQSLLALIGSFPPGSAGGPSGLRPSHLKDCLCEADASSQLALLHPLDTFIRLCLDGELPTAAVPYLCSAHLVPLRKTAPGDSDGPNTPAGESDIALRPVAVGEVLRRLVSKTLMAQGAMRRAMEDMEPLQCGMGLRGACELIGQATSAVVRELHGPAYVDDWAVLQVDLTNAFNQVSRQHMLQAFVQRCPEATHWMASSYGVPTYLFAGSLRLLSQAGVQQGDNMGPAGFCFASHDLWDSFQTMEGLLWQVWYMDDGTIVGSLSCLAKIVEAIQQLGPARGLHLNKAKCVMWGPAAQADNLAAYPPLQGMHLVPYVPGSGIRVLGVPVEHPAEDGTFTRALFSKAVDKLESMCSVLTRLPAAHVQYTLLRYCLDGCRLNFLTRCSSARHIPSLVERADNVLRQTLGDILGTPLTDKQWAQARLPQRHGGLGIGSPVDLATPGRLATIVDYALRAQKTLLLQPEFPLVPPDFLDVARRMQQCLGPEFAPLQGWIATPNSVLHAEEVHSRQHWWGDRWHKHCAKALPQGLPARDQARVALQQSQRGAAWLSLYPSSGQGTELNNDECRMALRFWLGAPLLPSRWQGAPCPLCGQALDTLGDHVVCCAQNHLKHRHSVLQGALYELAQLAGIPAAMEVALPDGCVPGDVCFRQWDADGPLMVDLTIRHPTPLSTAPPPVDGLRAWFAAQADEKESLYLDKCRRQGYSFLPFVVTPWGGLGPDAMKVMLRLQKLALGSKRGWARTRLAQQIWQKISLAVAKPVARQLTAILQVTEPAWGVAPLQHQPYA